MKYEQQFENARNKVHSIKQVMEEKQDLLNEMRHKLDRCDRHNESYLLLVADEHKLLLNSKFLFFIFYFGWDVLYFKVFINYSHDMRKKKETNITDKF